jgi:hypothetical protein
MATTLTQPSDPPAEASNIVAQENIGPPTRAQLAKLFANLHPAADAQTILLGLRIQRPEGYQLLDRPEGDPPREPPPGYHTLAISFRNGKTSVDADVSYLTVPQTSGFLYLGDATAVRDETDHEGGAENIQEGLSIPRYYAATDLWKTRDAAGILSSSTRLRQRLGRPAWGTTHVTTVVYVTPRAVCLDDADTSWRGGAHVFDASEHQHLEGFGARFEKTVFARHGASALLAFAHAVLEKYEVPPVDPETAEDVSIEHRTSFGTGGSVDWKHDAVPCLLREHGVVFDSGVVELNGNVDHLFAMALPICAAGIELAPSNRAPIAFDEVRKLYPMALDVVVAPNDALVVIVLPDRVVGYDVATRSEVLVHPLAIERVVMAEWASGKTASRWSGTLKALLRGARSAVAP